MAAVRANEDRAVLELLSSGVRPDAQAGAEQTPLMVAATNGNRRIVRLLLAAGAEVNARSADGNTAVIQAAENGHLAVVRALLRVMLFIPLLLFKLTQSATLQLVAQDHVTSQQLRKSASLAMAQHLISQLVQIFRVKVRTS